MEHICVIQCKDIDLDDEAVLTVRAGNEQVAVCISIMHDGDIEVVFPVEECDNLIEALQQAVSRARADKSKAE